MKYLFFIILAGSVLADTWDLQQGIGTYQVKHLVKRVESESKDIKGKIDCPKNECEFLLAVPVKSFTSSDSNRDSNMRDTVESLKYPVASAKGKFPKSDLDKTSWTIPAEVEFHGVKKPYEIKVSKGDNGKFKASFTLKLDQHKVERPSLFGVKIDDEVPMDFNLTWVKKG